MTYHFIWNPNRTDVASQYGEDFIQITVLKKVVMQYMLSLYPIIQTHSMMQIFQYLYEATRARHYRWGYHNVQDNRTIWVSGAALDETVVQKILTQAWHTGNLEEIAEKFGCGKVDLLAGIGDELMARLIAHDRSEWEEQIALVGNDIKNHIQSNQLALLC